MKKLIIAAALLSSVTFVQAQTVPYHGPNYSRRDMNHREFDNRRELMGLERNATEQKQSIDRAIYSRSINPSQATRVKEGFNRVLSSIDRAKLDRRVHQREIDRIQALLSKNERDLERMIRESHRRY